MKKTILALFLISVLLSGCKKDDPPSINLDKTVLILHHDEADTLTLSIYPDQSCTWSTLDSNVAIVTQVGLKGIVKGVRIGNTTISVKSLSSDLTATCNVALIPQSLLYQEPFYVYGESKSYIKSQEKRALEDESNDALLYKGESYNVRYVMYSFENSKLNLADVMLTSSDYIVESVKTFLDERYIYVGYSDGVAIYTDNKGTVLGLNYDTTLGLNILYFTSRSVEGKEFISVEFQKAKKVINEQYKMELFR